MIFNSVETKKSNEKTKETFFLIESFFFLKQKGKQRDDFSKATVLQKRKWDDVYSLIFEHYFIPHQSNDLFIWE